MVALAVDIVDIVSSKSLKESESALQKCYKLLVQNISKSGTIQARERLIIEKLIIKVVYLFSYVVMPIVMSYVTQSLLILFL